MTRGSLVCRRVDTMTSPSTVQVMLTTNAGLEDLAACELRARAAAQPSLIPLDIEIRPWGCFGRLLATFPLSALEPSLVQLLLSMRSVHDVMEHHTALDVPNDPDPALALYELLRKLPTADGGPVPPLLGGSRSFRVSCMREGDHGVHSFSNANSHLARANRNASPSPTRFVARSSPRQASPAWILNERSAVPCTSCMAQKRR